MSIMYENVHSVTDLEEINKNKDLGRARMYTGWLSLREIPKQNV